MRTVMGSILICSCVLTRVSLAEHGISMPILGAGVSTESVRLAAVEAGAAQGVRNSIFYGMKYDELDALAKSKDPAHKAELLGKLDGLVTQKQAQDLKRDLDYLRSAEIKNGKTENPLLDYLEKLADTKVLKDNDLVKKWDELSKKLLSEKSPEAKDQRELDSLNYELRRRAKEWGEDFGRGLITLAKPNDEAALDRASSVYREFKRLPAKVQDALTKERGDISFLADGIIGPHGKSALSTLMSRARQDRSLLEGIDALSKNGSFFSKANNNGDFAKELTSSATNTARNTFGAQDKGYSFLGESDHMWKATNSANAQVRRIDEMYHPSSDLAFAWKDTKMTGNSGTARYTSGNITATVKVKRDADGVVRVDGPFEWQAPQAAPPVAAAVVSPSLPASSQDAGPASISTSAITSASPLLGWQRLLAMLRPKAAR